MMKRFAQVAFVGAVILVTAVVAVNLKEKGKASDPYADFSVFAKVYNVILARYVEPVDESFLMEGAYRGAVESVFDQNSYIPAKMMENLEPRLMMTGRIGIDVIKRGGYAQVVHVFPGSEAESKGIEPGTILQQINGQYTWDLPLFAIRALLKGNPGDPVDITYYEMTRGEDVDESFRYEELPSPSAAIVDVDGVEALRVHSFSPETMTKASEFSASHGYLILDLRYTQDKHYQEMLNICAALSGQPVEATRRRKEGNQTMKSADMKPLGVPVYLLTSSFTMNAADVMGNLLSGHKDIKVVGGRLSGKAFESELFQLQDGAYVEMATTLYAPCVEDGLKPDVRSFIDDSEIADTLRDLLKQNGTEADGTEAAA